MNKGNWIEGIIIAALLIFCYFSCKHKCNDSVVNHSDTLIFRDTVTHVIEGKTQLVTIIKERADTLTKIDSIFAINNFFSKFVFKRRFTDTLLDATLLDTISQNKPTGAFSYKILRPQTIITNNTIIQQTKNRVYVSGLLNYDYISSKPTLQGGLIIISKGNKEYGIYANTRTISASFGLKIKLKR